MGTGLTPLVVVDKEGCIRDLNEHWVVFFTENGGERFDCLMKVSPKP